MRAPRRPNSANVPRRCLLAASGVFVLLVNLELGHESKEHQASGPIDCTIVGAAGGEPSAGEPVGAGSSALYRDERSLAEEVSNAALSVHCRRTAPCKGRCATGRLSPR